MDQNTTFGVELEGFGFKDFETISNIVKSVGFDCSRGYESGFSRWVVKTEGISSDDGTPGFELTTPVLKGDEGMEQFKTVLNALTNNGFKVNNSCGMHVHVGVPTDYSIQNMRSLIQRYRDNEREIDTYIIYSRRGSNNSYCGSLNEMTDTWMNRIDQYNRENNYNSITYVPTMRDFCKHFSRRKLAINQYLDHGTVEFRHHGGTTDSTVASMWIKFCINFMHTTKLMSDEVIEHGSALVGLSEEEINFFNERAAYLTMATGNR